MTTTSGELDGRFSNQEVAYLAQRAANDIGLVMTPACYCHKSGHAFERQVGCHSDTLLSSLSRCAESINRCGAASFLQIHHGGNAAKERFTGRPPLAPSAVINRARTSEMPREMTEQEIWMIVEAFTLAAQRAKRAGFTGIELHGANTYLFQQFFSPDTNRREDQWGCQSMENRSRFAREVVRAVRTEVGPDYPISYRISPEEPDPRGYSVYEAIELLQELVDLGIDIVHVSSWEYGAGVRHDYPDGSSPTLEIRRALPSHIPVIAVGGVMFPNQALRARSDGIELVALGRALLLNPDWAVKVRKGRIEEIVTSASTEAALVQLEIPDRMKGYVRRWFLSQT
jgi:2,4-dienoyl-CoA reductase-like NADH-dependent reductase (Old Yellow Enzyme family)